MTRDGPDAVDNIMMAVRTAAPELAPMRLRDIAARIRQEMGGTRRYIRKRSPRESSPGAAATVEAISLHVPSK